MVGRAHTGSGTGNIHRRRNMRRLVFAGIGLAVMAAVAGCSAVSDTAEKKAENTELTPSNDEGLDVYIFDLDGNDCIAFNADGEAVIIGAGKGTAELLTELEKLGLDKPECVLLPDSSDDYSGDAEALLQGVDISGADLFRSSTASFPWYNPEDYYKPDALNIRAVTAANLITPEKEGEQYKIRGEDTRHSFNMDGIYHSGGKMTVTKPDPVTNKREHLFVKDETYKVGAQKRGENYRILFLTPYFDDTNSKTKDRMGLTVLLEYRGRYFCFTSSINEYQETGALYVMEKIGIDPSEISVLQAANHGSDDATSQEFLDAVKPEYVFISCGGSYSAGQETLDRIKKAGCSLYRTDLQGALQIHCDKDGKITWSQKPTDNYTATEVGNEK